MSVDGSSKIDEEMLFLFEPTELSKWTCYLFGATEGDGIIWTPKQGQEPNWFWRKMQYLVFGNYWIYKE